MKPEQVDTITRAFRYFYDPRTGVRITAPGDGQSWYIELSAEEYEAAGLLSKAGGFDAVAAAAYKCGFDIPSHGIHDYAIGECWEPGCGNGEKPIRYFSFNQAWLCREHYEQAAGE